MIRSNLDNLAEIKDGSLCFNRKFYEATKEGITFMGTEEELKPLEKAFGLK